MKPFIKIFLLFFCAGLFAQSTISGNFAPAQDYTWLIVYKLTPSGQQFIADTTIEQGAFNVTLPEKASPGMYRLVYAVPQDEFYIDILYNQKNDIAFNFSQENGILFTKSEENIWYQEYLSKIILAEEKLNRFIEENNNSSAEYLALRTALNDIQNTYEKNHTETIANVFIKANRIYIPKKITSFDDFLADQKEHYFDHLNFDNPALQSSNFLIDKVIYYVYALLPTTANTRPGFIREVNLNIETIANKLLSTPTGFQKKIMHSIWKIANTNNLPQIEDSIFDNHLRTLATSTQDVKMLQEIEAKSKARVGTICPEISWSDNNKTYALSKIEGAENYIIIFWSSTCSHCLKDVPALHEELKKYPKTKVLAFGLENNRDNWSKVTRTMPNFTHGIGLQKWENEYVKTFNIQQTPTYFVLNKDKIIIAKPTSKKELIQILNTLN